MLLVKPMEDSYEELLAWLFPSINFANRNPHQQ